MKTDWYLKLCHGILPERKDLIEQKMLKGIDQTAHELYILGFS